MSRNSENQLDRALNRLMQAGAGKYYQPNSQPSHLGRRGADVAGPVIRSNRQVKPSDSNPGLKVGPTDGQKLKQKPKTPVKPKSKTPVDSKDISNVESYQPRQRDFKSLGYNQSMSSSNLAPVFNNLLKDNKQLYNPVTRPDPASKKQISDFINLQLNDWATHTRGSCCSDVPRDMFVEQSHSRCEDLTTGWTPDLITSSACNTASMPMRSDIQSLITTQSQINVEGYVRDKAITLNKTLALDDTCLAVLDLDAPGGLGLKVNPAMALVRKNVMLARYIAEATYDNHMYPETAYSIEVNHDPFLTGNLCEYSVVDAETLSRVQKMSPDFADFLQSMEQTNGFVAPTIAQYSNEPRLSADSNCELKTLVACSVRPDLSDVKLVDLKNLNFTNTSLFQGRRVFVIFGLFSTTTIRGGAPIEWCYASSYELHRFLHNYTSCHTDEASATRADQKRVAKMEAIKRRMSTAKIVNHGIMTVNMRPGSDLPLHITYLFEVEYSASERQVMDIVDFLLPDVFADRVLFDYLNVRPKLQTDPIIWPIYRMLLNQFDKLAKIPTARHRLPEITWPESKDGEYFILSIMGHIGSGKTLQFFVQWEPKPGHEPTITLERLDTIGFVDLVVEYMQQHGL